MRGKKSKLPLRFSGTIITHKYVRYKNKSTGKRVAFLHRYDKSGQTFFFIYTFIFLFFKPRYSQGRFGEILENFPVFEGEFSGVDGSAEDWS